MGYYVGRVADPTYRRPSRRPDLRVTILWPSFKSSCGEVTRLQTQPHFRPAFAGRLLWLRHHLGLPLVPLTELSKSNFRLGVIFWCDLKSQIADLKSRIHSTLHHLWLSGDQKSGHVCSALRYRTSMPRAATSNHLSCNTASSAKYWLAFRLSTPRRFLFHFYDNQNYIEFQTRDSIQHTGAKNTATGFAITFLRAPTPSVRASRPSRMR